MKIKDLLKRDEIFPLVANLDPDKVYSVDIHEPKEKRSLNANSYAWVLITKLANFMRLSKDEVYLMMLERYGQSQVISVLSEVNINGFIKYYRSMGRHYQNGRDYTVCKIIKGSSEYDTQEMSVFIDGIVSECQDLGIETMTPEELENLKSQWKNAPNQ